MSYHHHSSACFQNLLKPSQSWYVRYPAQPFRAQRFQAWKHLHDFHSNFLPASWSSQSCRSHSPRHAFHVSTLPTASSCGGGDRTPVCLATAASLARNTTLRYYTPFPFLLPRVIFHPSKGPQIYTDRVMSKRNSVSKLSRSMSCVNIVTAVQIVQLRFMFHAGPPSQPHLTFIRLKYCCQGKEDSLSLTPWSLPRLPWRLCALVALAGHQGEGPRDMGRLCRSMQDPAPRASSTRGSQLPVRHIQLVLGGR